MSQIALQLHSCVDGRLTHPVRRYKLVKKHPHVVSKIKNVLIDEVSLLFLSEGSRDIIKSALEITVPRHQFDPVSIRPMYRQACKEFDDCGGS